MTVLRNNVDVGPDGTLITVANSDDTGGDPWDGASTGGGTTTFEYSSDYARSTAQYVMHVATGATAANPQVAWSTSMGSQSQFWMRFYVLWPTVPTGGALLFWAHNGVTSGYQIGLNTGDNRMSVVVGAGVSIPTTGSLSAGQWIRIEARMQCSTTTANGEVRYFADPDSETWDESLAWTNKNSAITTCNQFYYGINQSGSNQLDTYLSGLALSNVDWLGPAPPRLGKGSPAGNLSNPIAIHTDCF